MKIKQILFHAIMLTAVSGVVVSAGIKNSPTTAGSSKTSAAMPKPNTPEFETMMEQQMEELGKFLEGQSPQEQEEIIKFLSALGEQIINEAAEKGYSDPFEYIAKELAVDEDEDEAAQPITETPDFTAREKISTLDEKQAIEQIKGLLQSLADVLSMLRHKTNGSSELAPKVDAFKYRIDDLIYFCRLFDDQKFASYLLKKEFSEIMRKIESLYDALYPLVQNLNIPDFSLKGEDPYSRLEIAHAASQNEIVEAFHQQASKHHPECIRNEMARSGKSAEEIALATKKAEKNYEKIKDAYQMIRDEQESAFIINKSLDEILNATEPGGVLDGFKKILEAYEPEALKKRQEKEKAEQDARKAQEALIRQRPAISYKDFDMPSSGSSWRGNPFKDTSNYGSSGYTPSWQPSTPPLSSGPASFGATNKPTKLGGGTKGSPDKKKDEKEKGKDKKDDNKKEKKGGSDKPKPAKDEAVIKAVGNIEMMLDTCKEDVKKNTTMLTKLPGYLATEDAQAEIKSEELQKVIGDIAFKLSTITRTFKNKKADFAKDKDKNKAKSYEEDVKKAVKKFRESEEGKILAKISLALSDDGTQIASLDKDGNLGDLTKRTKIPATRMKEFIIPAEAAEKGEKGKEEEATENRLTILRQNVKALFDIAGEEKKPAPQN